jgi:hypothetical protein
MMKLRLKGIFQEVDFRYNELSIYERYRKDRSFQGDPKLGETYLFVSTSGNQLLWVLRYEDKVLVHKTMRKRIETLRFRVSGGSWNPLMLANYAEEIGITLEGIRKFEEIYAAKTARKLSGK